jgi:predicted nucleic acid-binding protein
MATKVGERAVLDANVLLAATDDTRAEYARARQAFDEWPAQATTLYVSGQILREYLSVATRPQTQNGLGLSQVDSIGNVHALRERLHVLDENDKVATRLLSLLDTVACSGKQVHDANIVATMLVHGIDTLVTINVRDFSRFGEVITVLAL